MPSLIRVIRGIAVVVIVTFAVSALLQFAPGSVAQAILGDFAPPEQVADLEDALGVNRPFLVQYFDWLADAVQGDLGRSPLTGQSVMEAIVERLPVTLQLAAMALSIALIVAVLFAMLSAIRPDSKLDRALSGTSSMFLSIPAFVGGPILILLLAVHFRFFPVSGWVPLTENPVSNLRRRDYRDTEEHRGRAHPRAAAPMSRHVVCGTAFFWAGGVLMRSHPSTARPGTALLNTKRTVHVELRRHSEAAGSLIELLVRGAAPVVSAGSIDG